MKQEFLRAIGPRILSCRCLFVAIARSRLCCIPPCEQPGSRSPLQRWVESCHGMKHQQFPASDGGYDHSCVSGFHPKVIGLESWAKDDFDRTLVLPCRMASNEVGHGGP